MARHILRLVDHPRRQIEAGPVNLITIAGFRFLPFVYDRIVGPLFGLAALTRAEAAPEPGNTLESQPERGTRAGPLAVPVTHPVRPAPPDRWAGLIAFPPVGALGSQAWSGPTRRPA